jgi:hypothetical protein
MPHPFDHPALAKYRLYKITTELKSKPAFLLPSSILLFACGGSTNPETQSVRAQFLKWAKNNLQSCRIVLAESAFAHLFSSQTAAKHSKSATNIAKFEEFIGNIADRILIFPESVGSYAETGYFSKSEKLRKKCWVIQNYDFDSHESFLNRGPIALIERHTFFKKQL